MFNINTVLHAAILLRVKKLMRLTKQTNYAIRMLMYCAANEGRMSRVQDIASAYNISVLFLSKLSQPLIKKGYLNSVRGPTGGVQLAMPAKDIRLSAVIKVTEDNFHIAECFSEEETACPLAGSCGLSLAFQEALSAFFAVLDNYTVEDLVTDKFGLQNLLSIDLLNENKH